MVRLLINRLATKAHTRSHNEFFRWIIVNNMVFFNISLVYAVHTLLSSYLGMIPGGSRQADRTVCDVPYLFV